MMPPFYDIIRWGDCMKKKLYRNKQDAKIAGVCSGVADYFEVDVTLVRVIWLVLAIGGVGSGILLYIILALVLPEK